MASTTIVAIDTGVAASLLLQNSGVPERFRPNKNELKGLEKHLKSIVDMALVPADDGVNRALAGCLEKFRTARQSVKNNTAAASAQKE
ncbi:hypothetical protein DL769_007405 [Monosporascus sp. CRB-8-3]|nr:hypothetical protein DL769_007405 [Monosporascus sp. CRB-8-3]